MVQSWQSRSSRATKSACSGRVEALLDDGQHGSQVAAHQGGRVEPEAGKDRAAKDAVRPGVSGR